MAEGKIRIKLIRSPICTPEKHKVIVRALGLKKMNQIVERPDTPGFRGSSRRFRTCWHSLISARRLATGD
jgi:large subunit ribosomal protein L30